MVLIGREPLKIQEGSLKNVAESTCRGIGKGASFAELRMKKKA
jgi:hypothetical protein